MNKYKQELFEEYLRWRANEGKNESDPGIAFYGWSSQNKEEVIKNLNIGTGYQEIMSWVKGWERSKK